MFVLFKGKRVIVPNSLRSEMLDLIHYNHLGISKCQLRTRETLFWSKNNKYLEFFYIDTILSTYY